MVSDLHLGARAGGDLLQRPRWRERLLREVADVDRVLLLGDIVELRERPLAEAVDAATPFFDELGEALGEGEVVLVGGNHDHQLAAPVLEPRRLKSGPPLGLEQTAKPGRSGTLSALARRLGSKTSLTIAYPGLWLRDDCYAFHGHYLDVHITVPTFEALAVSIVERLVGDLPEGSVTPDDYEAPLAPVYAFAYALAQGRRRAGRAVGAGASLGLWDRLNATGGRRGLEAKLLGSVLVPGAITALNLAGFGPFGGTISAEEIRRAGLRGVGEVVKRLGIEADHVVFGHTHRPGPLSGFDRKSDWVAPGGARLHNSGGWVYERSLSGAGPADSPYWPGACVVVPESGPPEVRRLLEDADKGDFEGD